MDVVDVTERLMEDFEDRLALNVISGVVRKARQELDATASGSSAEQVERLARQRLQDLVRVPQQRPSDVQLT